jgi:hypothetical protein
MPIKTIGIQNANQVLPAPGFVTQVASSGAGAVYAVDTPAGASHVSFGPQIGMDIFVVYGSTAASQSTSPSTAGTSPECNPTARNIGSTASTTGLSIAFSASGICSLSWFKP